MRKFKPLTGSIITDYRGLLRRIEKYMGLTGVQMAKLMDTTKQAYSQMAQHDNVTLRTIAKLEESLDTRILVVNPELLKMLEKAEGPKQED